MILLVEDDSGLNELERRVLTDAGFEVRAVERGDDALLVLAEEIVDLVILDYRLPDMTGLDVLAALPDDPPPVLVVSGYADPTLERRMLDAGARRFIYKDGAMAFLDNIVAATREELAGRVLV